MKHYIILEYHFNAYKTIRVFTKEIVYVNVKKLSVALQIPSNIYENIKYGGNFYKFIKSYKKNRHSVDHKLIKLHPRESVVCDRFIKYKETKIIDEFAKWLQKNKPKLSEQEIIIVKETFYGREIINELLLNNIKN